MTSRALSYWESAAGLSPTSTAPLPPSTCDVLIVGAGFAGSWLAYFLKVQRPSLRIAIVERDFFALGASSRNAGFLSCGNISEWSEDLTELGWAEMTRTFSARLGGIRLILSELAPAVENCGSIDFDSIDEEKRGLLSRLNEWLIDQGERPFYRLREARLGGISRQVIENTFDGAIDPVAILQALHAKLRVLGVVLHRPVTVRALGDGLAEIESVRGPDIVRYRHAFLCTNAFARKLHPATPVEPARGQCLVTSRLGRADTERCLGFLRAGYDYFRFIGDRLLIGGGRWRFRRDESSDEIETSAALRDYLESLAAEILGHRDFEIEHHWAGIMGLRAGRHASIGELLQPVRIDARTEELFTCGGWGVTLSPFVARQRAIDFLSID